MVTATAVQCYDAMKMAEEGNKMHEVRYMF